MMFKLQSRNILSFYQQFYVLMIFKNTSYWLSFFVALTTYCNIISDC